MPSPYLCKRFHPTCSLVGKSLSFSILQRNAKAAAPGFEHETRGDLLSLSFVVVNERCHRIALGYNIKLVIYVLLWVTSRKKLQIKNKNI